MSSTDRIISRKEFRALIGVSRTTEWRMMQKGLLPTPFVVDDKVLGYTETSYHKWIEQKSFK